MAAQPSVFDDMDDLTAQLCIQLQLEDVAALAETLPESDREVALQLHEAELKAYRVERGLPDPPAASIVWTRCEACGDQFPEEGCLTVPCHHQYCQDCLGELFSLSMRDKTLYPPRCCRQAIPWDLVRNHVKEPLATDFEAKREELEDKNPLYCHDKHCSQYIKAVNIGEANEASCSSCWKVTCTLCKQKQHEGACPQDEEVQKMRAYAEEEGCKECTRCHHLVELSTGCNHITCLCKHEFCYCCGVQWKHCECELFEEENLLERAQEVADRPGMGGAAAAPAIAEQLRRDHQRCDDDGHGYMEKIEDGEMRCEGCRQVQGRFIFRCYTCHTQLCYRCKNNRA